MCFLWEEGNFARRTGKVQEDEEFQAKRWRTGSNGKVWMWSENVQMGKGCKRSDVSEEVLKIVGSLSRDAGSRTDVRLLRDRF